MGLKMVRHGRLKMVNKKPNKEDMRLKMVNKKPNKEDMRLKMVNKIRKT